MKSTHAHEITQRQLQELFDFTPADLRINRTLRLSPDQIDSLSLSARWGIILGGLIGLAVAVATELLAHATGYAVLAFLLIFGLVTWLARRRKRRRAALLSRGVAMARGQASVRLQDGDRRRAPVYRVEIDGKAFLLDQPTADIFAEGGTFEVYFIAGLNHRIVSADQIG